MPSTIGASRAADRAAAPNPAAHANSEKPSTTITWATSAADSAPRALAASTAVAARSGPAIRSTAMSNAANSAKTPSDTAAVPPITLTSVMADCAR